MVLHFTGLDSSDDDESNEPLGKEYVRSLFESDSDDEEEEQPSGESNRGVEQTDAQAHDDSAKSSQADLAYMIENSLLTEQIDVSVLEDILKKHKARTLEKELGEKLEIGLPEYDHIQETITQKVVEETCKVFYDPIVQDFDSIDKLVRSVYPDASYDERVDMIAEKFTEMNDFSNIENLFDYVYNDTIQHFRHKDVIVDYLREHLPNGEDDDDIQVERVVTPKKRKSPHSTSSKKRKKNLGLRKKQRASYPTYAPTQEELQQPKSSYIFPLAKVKVGDSIVIRSESDGEHYQYTIIKGGRGVIYDNGDINMGDAKMAIKNGTAVKYIQA